MSRKTTMNHRNAKRVKDPKACASCANCVKELNGARPTTYRCSVTPIVAGEKVCEKAIPRPEPPEVKPTHNFQESVGPLLRQAHNYMQDIQNLNSELSSDSALLLLSMALTDIKAVASILEINVEG